MSDYGMPDVFFIQLKQRTGKKQRSQLEWGTTIQAGSCYTIDVIHHQSDIAALEGFQRAPFRNDPADKLVVLLQTPLLPRSHRIAIKQSGSRLAGQILFQEEGILKLRPIIG